MLTFSQLVCYCILTVDSLPHNYTFSQMLFNTFTNVWASHYLNEASKETRAIMGFLVQNCCYFVP